MARTMILSKKELNVIISFAVAKFKKVMPPIEAPYPQIRVATADEASNEDSLADLTKYFADSNVILIYSNAIQERMKDLEDEVMEFAHWDKMLQLMPNDMLAVLTNDATKGMVGYMIIRFLWQSLGAFYAHAEAYPEAVKAGTAAKAPEAKGNVLDVAQILAKNKNLAVEPQPRPLDPRTISRIVFIEQGRGFVDSFIAESIACYVCNRVMPHEPPNGDWNGDWDFDDWSHTSNFMARELRQIFEPISAESLNDEDFDDDLDGDLDADLDDGFDDDDTVWDIAERVDEIGLALYFSHLLMDEAVTQYSKAAAERRLKISDGVEDEIKEWAEDGTGSGGTGAIYAFEDPTHFSKLDNRLQFLLYEIKAILERQLKKAKFWQVKEDLLAALGRRLSDMRGIMVDIIREYWG